MKKKKRRLFDILRIFGVLVALSIMLYPTVSNYIYEKNSSRVVNFYDEAAAALEDEERLRNLAEAEAYNVRLAGTGYVEGDAFGSVEELTEEYESLLNVDQSSMMGYIVVPKINVELPIYHGTSEAVLQSGIGHLASSSLPVGGETTHAVLTGHRGLPSRMLFTDLDQIVEGDIFYIRIQGETLAYQVDQILTVLPEETEALQIVPGKDYVTLVTCTPYGVNTHRLLVRGHRIPYEEAETVEPLQVDHGIKIPFEVVMLLIGFGIVLLLLIIWQRKEKRAGKKQTTGKAKRREKK